MTTATPTKWPKPAEILRVLNSPVNALLLAKCHAEIEREKMDAVDRKLLALIKPVDERTGEIITDPRKAWHMSDEVAKDYFAERQIEIDALGYKLERGFCPALVAENLVRLAERTLIEAAMVWFPDADPQSLLCLGLEKYRRYINLLVGMTTSLSNYRKPDLKGGRP